MRDARPESAWLRCAARVKKKTFLHDQDSVVGSGGFDSDSDGLD
jgi:hypothetical protein